MSFGVPWGTPFYSGGGTSSLVPTQYDFALAGRAYMIDTRNGNGIETADIAIQRAQADTNGDPSEATLSTEGLWRRILQSWHRGGKQTYYDRPESDRFRFDTSSGVDPWTKNRLSLLPSTALSLASANTNLYLVAAAGRLYVADGQVVRYTTDLTSWTAITGNPAQTITGLATDGATVYVGYGTSGVYTIASGAASMASYATGTASNVGYAKGRLLVVETSGANPRVYNVTAAGAITSGTLLLTVPGATFPAGQWTAESPTSILLVGVVGDQTRIWRTAIKQDGTALDVPVIAGELPDGQLARSVASYLGSVVLIGADTKVWVLGYADNAGNLALRGNVATTSACQAFEAQEDFVWYGTNSATLGRMDLRTNVALSPGDFVPGTADDLVAALSGTVTGIATYSARRVFGVSGRGVYAEQTAKVASGTLSTGIVGFGIGDLKNALFADVRFLPLVSGDTITVEVAKDNGAYDTVGTVTEVGSISATVELGQLLAETVSVRLTLAGAPTVTMLTVRAAPAPVIGEVIRVPLLFFHNIEDIHGAPQTQDVPAEVEYLENLRKARTAVTAQIGSTQHTVLLDRLVSFKTESKALASDGSWLGYWNGVMVCDLKRIDG